MRRVYILMGRTSCEGEEEDCLAIYDSFSGNIVERAARLLVEEYEWLTEEYEENAEIREEFESALEWVYTMLNSDDEDFPFYIRTYEARL